MNKPITFPPALWLTILVPAAAWVQEQFPFPEFWWSPLVVTGIGAAIKLIQVYWPETGGERLESARGYLWTSRAWRFWMGG